MLKKLKQLNKGFTIIEVMIVLAIAGLIMLIVFLAVPALQRSQRNNSRKSDASRIGAAVSDFVSNNNGSLPAGIAGESSTQQLADCTGILTAIDVTKLGQYNSIQQTCVATDITPDIQPVIDRFRIATAPAAGAYTLPTTPVRNSMVLVEKSVCSGQTSTTTGAQKRNAVLLYTQEAGTSKWAYVCLSVQ